MISLSLPYPPTINHYYGRKRNGQIYIKKQGVEYRKFVVDYVAQIKITCMYKALSTRIFINMPDRRLRDCDNVLKCLLDSMEKAKVYKNDNQIEELYIKKCPIIKGGACLVEITELESSIYSND